MNVLAKLFSWWSDRHSAAAGHPQPATEYPERIEMTVGGNPVEVGRDAYREIAYVRIGAWRIITATRERRIADIRSENQGQQVAICIELAQPLSTCPVTTVWETYDRNGQLVSLLQSTDDSQLWLQTRCHPENAAAKERTSSGESSLAIPAWT